MSLNISKKVLAVSKITVEVRISDLPKRQQTNLKRFVKSGIVAGSSVPATLAKYILDNRGLPYIWKYRTTSSYCYPSRCPIGSKGYEIIKECYAQSLLEGDDKFPPDYWRENDPTKKFLDDPDSQEYVVFLDSVAKDMHKHHSFNHEVEIEEVIAMKFGAKDHQRSL